MDKLTPFQEEALNIQDHVSLTANAGSGKTFVLANRYLKIALETGIHLSKIVAITFTDKAAGELYSKISKKIDERYISESDFETKKKLAKIKRQLVSANISTIHSFCTSVLREFSPDAGLDANFTTVDSEEGKDYILRSIDSVLENLLNKEDNSTIKYLIRVAGSKRNIIEQFKKLIYNRKKLQKLSKLIYCKSEEEIVNFFDGVFEKYFAEIFNEDFDVIIDKIKRIVETVLSYKSDNVIAQEVNAELQKYTYELSSSEKIIILKEIRSLIITTQGLVKSRGFADKKWRDGLEDDIHFVEQKIKEFGHLFKCNDSSDGKLELARYSKKIVEVFEHIDKIYRETKTEKSALDFEDLLIYTRDLLKNNESVRDQLNKKYEYIMVDEYQDTNQIQYDIFMPILEYLKSGNLFVVGDEKQSIYRFRDADLKVFSETKNQIKENSNTENPKNLPHSFRLSSEVALFTNILFNKVFENPKDYYNEVGYEDLVCANQDDKGEIEVLLSYKDESPSEAELIAAKISQLVKNESLNIKFSDIAILCRKRNSFAKLENVFSEANIPNKILSGKGFYQRQTIYDIYNFVSFLVNPSNDISLIGILRSPFYQLSDELIFNISNEIGYSFFEKLKIYKQKNSKVNNVYISLKNFINLTNKISIRALIRKILVDTGYLFVVSSLHNGNQEIQNIEKLIGLANSFEEMSFKTLFDFAEKLKENIESTTDENQAELLDAEDAVNILTIHSSKGLEFKAVFIYETNSKSKWSGIKAGEITVDNELGILTKLPQNNDYFGEKSELLIHGMYNHLNQRREEAEAKRLLYVAITRAINYLGISATIKKDEKDKKPAKKSENGSFLSILERTLGNQLFHIGQFQMSSKMEFMFKQKDVFVKETRPMSLEINITDSIEFSPIEKLEIETKELNLKYLEAIKSYEKNEVLSASKLNVFLQCPLKYQLIYELGYQKLSNIFRDETDIEKFEPVDNSEIPADMRGRIIHSILEEGIPDDKLNLEIEKKLSIETDLIESSQINKDSAVNEIYGILKTFYESKVYDEIRIAENYYNEYEIYLMKDDLFLYGIIDKLIINNNEIIIIDYKTDFIDSEHFKEKVDGYLGQLKFYAYLINQKYNDDRDIVLKLIFIREPDRVFETRMSSVETKNFGEVIMKSVNDMRKEVFEMNEKHCRQCQFFINNACITKP